MATLDALLQRIHRIAGRNTLLIGGDFNSQHRDWGYRYNTARGRRLWTTIQDLRLTTHNNFLTPTRIGNSVTMDTSPDLTLSRSLKDISWSRTQHILGSEHYIIAIQIPHTPHRPRLLTHNLIHWDAIRSPRRELPNTPIQDIDHWVSSLLDDITAHTQKITTPPNTPTLDTRLAHLWEAHHSILERWKRQKHNRTLRRRLATLQTQITAHAEELCRSNWGQVCNSTAGNLSTNEHRVQVMFPLCQDCCQKRRRVFFADCDYIYPLATQLTAFSCSWKSMEDTHVNTAPRLTDRRPVVRARQGDNVKIPCAAQGYPIPTYSWHRLEGGWKVSLDSAGRVSQVDGTLLFRRAVVGDGGKYVCVVNNSIGEDRMETQLTITAPLTAMVRPRRMVATEGAPATLNCTTSGHPVSSVVWLKNGQPVVSSRVKMLTRERLHIPNVLRDDKGMYQCFALNDYDWAQGTAEITLGDDPPVLVHRFSEQTVEPGSPVSLKCAATGAPLPQITWSLDGEPVIESMRVRIGDFVTNEGQVNSFVNVTAATTEDGGRYQCHASNDVETVSHGARMNVRGHPFVRVMRNVSVLAGRTLIVHCPAAGYPLTQIFWHKGDARLPQSKRQSVFRNGTLTVHRVERNADEGFYRCTATGPSGRSASRELYVSVMVAPVVGPFSFPANLKEGMRAIVTCSVLEGDSPVRIRWLKDTTYLAHFAFHMLQPKQTSKNSFLVCPGQVGYRHRGEYTCVASNLAASANYSSNMVVNVPPRWKVAPREKAAVVGENVVIDCQAEGFPPPRIWWEKSSAARPTEYKVIISNSHIHTLENGSLMVREAERNDTGFYLCQASNGVGSGISKVIELKVHAKWSGDIRESRLQGRVTTLTLRDLRPVTTYLVRIQAENSLGAGEFSQEIQVTTDEEDPPPSPTLSVFSTSSTSIQLQWSPNEGEDTSIIGYYIYVKAEHGTWEEHQVSAHQTTHTFQDLLCGTNYQFYVASYNKMGKSDPSEVISAKTQGAPPVPPKRDALISVNGTMLMVHLSSWSSAGCPIQSFTVHYRIEEEDYDWVLVSDAIPAEQKVLVISGLLPGKWYLLRVAGHSEAGTSEQEYTFSTLTKTGASIPPLNSLESRRPAFYKSVSIMVPLVCVVAMLVLIVAVLAFIIPRRRRQATPHHYRDPCSDDKNMEALSLSILKQPGERMETASPGKEQLYYPSPYAMGRVQTLSKQGVGPSDTDAAAAAVQTLKRARREHIYEIEEEGYPYVADGPNEHVPNIYQAPKKSGM
ncbi:hypothetical protein HPB51_004148 [Rhipicephalus microplus]|uniref:Down syndrome cell adhesion molecule-like protein Dscam2 n=1 Tax=Rhipicephalus microplus TaxID=6941 RepID=A0A9J6DT87_RHIMP|nr:hypothetical protein HPB51_004148 [Rhipicephalus microplus]